ncbi:MAG: branched-chain amino acid ABC transporter permease [Micromonosporaceae bacterium]
MDIEVLLVHSLNGLSYGALLFLVASGFTLIFGLLRIVNLAHGAFYLLGAYLGLATLAATGNFLFALFVAASVVGGLGLSLERSLLKRVRGKELPEVLLTIGIAFVIADLCLAIFSGDPQSMAMPAALSGTADLGSVTYPRYRLVLVLIAALLAIALYLLQRHTKIGAIVRAGVDDREMAAAMGINIDRVFTGMFAFGAALAGLAGVIGAGLLPARPGADIEILLFALVVVIIGGLGSVKGAAVGSVLIGLIDAYSKVWLPDFSYFTVFAPMALVLVFRPVGLFGRTA